MTGTSMIESAFDVVIIWQSVNATGKYLLYFDRNG